MHTILEDTLELHAQRRVAPHYNGLARRAPAPLEHCLQGFAQSVVNPVSAGWRINYDARNPVLARARARRVRAAEQRCAGPETLRLGVSDTPWLPVRRPGLTAQSCTKVRTR